MIEFDFTVLGVLSKILFEGLQDLPLLRLLDHEEIEGFCDLVVVLLPQKLSFCFLFPRRGGGVKLLLHVHGLVVYQQGNSN